MDTKAVEQGSIRSQPKNTNEAKAAVSNRAAATERRTRFVGALCWLQFSAGTRDYSRYVKLIAETDPADVPFNFAEVRFAAATPATALAGASARGPARHAGRLARKGETGQRHSEKAKAKPFEGLPTRHGLGHTFRKLIEFVVHNSFLSPYGVLMPSI